MLRSLSWSQRACVFTVKTYSYSNYFMGRRIFIVVGLKSLSRIKDIGDIQYRQKFHNIGSFVKKTKESEFRFDDSNMCDHIFCS